jgi:uncharacterized membrane protein YgcG
MAQGKGSANRLSLASQATEALGAWIGTLRIRRIFDMAMPPHDARGEGFMTGLSQRVIASCLLVLLASVAQALEVPGKSGKRFHNESAELRLPETRVDAVEDRLHEIETDYPGVQMAVLIIDSLEGEPIEDFSLRVAEKWKLGRKRSQTGDPDSGLLLVVAVRDKKYRFEVGYGLEAVLPDARIGAIGRDALVPAFTEGRYLDGIYKAVDSVKRTLDKARPPSARSFVVPPLGDRRFHNHSTLLKLQDHETSGLEISLDRFEWGLDGMASLRMAILVIDSLEGEPIDSLSARVAEKWELGRKSDDRAEGDNGLLLVLAMKDRKYRFESGGKLEGLVPETLAEAIARDILIQDFWAAQYEGGLRRTIDAVTALAQGEYPQSLALAEQSDRRDSWERLADFVRYGTFSRPTSYDYVYSGAKKIDPAWGRVRGQATGDGRWIMIAMIVIAGVFGFFHYLLGGAVGVLEGTAFSWLYVSHAWPVLLLSAAIGLAVGTVSKYLAIGAIVIGISGRSSEGGGFGGGGAGGSW